jgi:hypothetical protein
MIGRAYEPRMGTSGPATGGAARTVAIAALQLILPVLLLLALGAMAYLYYDQPVTWFGSGQASWLTMGHLLLPLTFFAIALTNRRYGAGYALAQTGLAWLVVAAAVIFAGPDLAVATGHVLPPEAVMIEFGSALFASHLFSVAVFDGTRGPRWWTAPLHALLWGGVTFCLIAFPALYLGTSIDWFGRLLVYAGIMAGAAFLLLLPYWLLRSLVPPLPGFGGY